ncbi:hypothetical protein PR048_031577 [Dryococelus australis]|uniref:Uncharacterized protein n=1 Tax=Dryococelus australis TaxID=614101 RepID=A0ABQ9G5P4_9NEOP|nr:hypothetical protein PR048_031577 [Dryococelus australis]
MSSRLWRSEAMPHRSYAQGCELACSVPVALRVPMGRELQISRYHLKTEWTLNPHAFVVSLSLNYSWFDKPWAALSQSEARKEHRRNEKGGGGNQPTTGIVRHDSHLGKSGVTRLKLNPVCLGVSNNNGRINDGTRGHEERNSLAISSPRRTAIKRVNNRAIWSVARNSGIGRRGAVNPWRVRATRVRFPAGHPDFGFPWFPEITPGEYWDGSLTKAMADSFPILPQSLFPVQLAPSLMTSLASGTYCAKPSGKRSWRKVILSLGHPCGIETDASPSFSKHAFLAKDRHITEHVNISRTTFENRIRLEIASQKLYSHTHKTAYDRVKRCRERKTIVKASERFSVDAEVYPMWLQVALKQGPFKSAQFIVNSLYGLTCQQDGVSDQKNTGSPFANQRIATYSPADTLLKLSAICRDRKNSRVQRPHKHIAKNWSEALSASKQTSPGRPSASDITDGNAAKEAFVVATLHRQDVQRWGRAVRRHASSLQPTASWTRQSLGDATATQLHFRNNVPTALSPRARPSRVGWASATAFMNACLSAYCYSENMQNVLQSKGRDERDFRDELYFNCGSGVITQLIRSWTFTVGRAHYTVCSDCIKVERRKRDLLRISTPESTSELLYNRVHSTADRRRSMTFLTAGSPISSRRSDLNSRVN